MSLLILVGVGVLAIIILITLFAMFYTVVEPSEAHVVVRMNSGRKVYSPSNLKIKDPTTGEIVEEKFSTSYFFIPFLMRRIPVSLEKDKHEINGVELRDLNVAPFKCDTTCWFKITDPALAAESLSVGKDGNIMDSIRETLDAKVQGVTRAAAMKLEVIDLMRDRKTFGDGVYEEVNGSLKDWGVQLVELEIIDFSDVEGSNVIRDHQARSQAQISSETRKVVAEENKEAEVKEAETKKVSETARIASEQAVELRKIEKAELVGKRNEKARLEVAMQQDKANAQKVKADRTLEVGEAEIVAEAVEVEADGKAKAVVKTSQGKASAIKVEASAEADAERVTGQAEADVIEAKGTAKATAIGKEADAQKKFTDVSKDIEMAKIAADIQKTQYTSMAQAMEKADINIVSEDMSFMGFGAKQGAGMGALIKNLQDASGADLSGLVTAIADKMQKKPSAKA